MVKLKKWDLSLQDKELARKFKLMQIYLKNNGLREYSKAICNEGLDTSGTRKKMAMERNAGG